MKETSATLDVSGFVRLFAERDLSRYLESIVTRTIASERGVATPTKRVNGLASRKSGHARDQGNSEDNGNINNARADRKNETRPACGLRRALRLIRRERTDSRAGRI